LRLAIEVGSALETPQMTGNVVLSLNGGAR
jgi:hypothetical protein